MKWVPWMSTCESTLQCITGNLSQMHREQKLLVPERDYAFKGAEPILRSGLYIIRTSTSAAEEQTYVLYWPEDTTWDDNTFSMVQRNRVTFMRYGSISVHFFSGTTIVSRYLTKICDQLVCLLSSKHSQAIVWDDEVDDPDDFSFDLENVDSDRLFDFTVAKKSEQAENVSARRGFTVCYNRYHAFPPY